MYGSPVQANDIDGYPLPEDPTLAEMAVAMRDATHWASIVDAEWRIVYVTVDLRLAGGYMVERLAVQTGLHMFGAESLNMQLEARTGAIALETMRTYLAQFGS
jgi:hypothetical protein